MVHVSNSPPSPHSEEKNTKPPPPGIYPPPSREYGPASSGVFAVALSLDPGTGVSGSDGRRRRGALRGHTIRSNMESVNPGDHNTPPVLSEKH